MNVLTKQIQPHVGLVATAISSDTTTDGAEIDTKGFDSALVITQVHAWTAGDVTPVINETATSGSGYTAVADAFLINEANETLDDFESKGVIVKPAEPVGWMPQPPIPPMEQRTLGPIDLQPDVPDPVLAPSCSGGSCPVPTIKESQTVARPSCSGGVCRPRARLFRRLR